MRDFVQDLRFALRMVVKNPGFTGVAMVTLALGVGVNTMIFSVLYGILMRPLPYVQPDRLVALRSVSAVHHEPRGGISQPDFEDLRDHARCFDGMGAYYDATLALSIGSRPERVGAGIVSAGMFHVLGIRPALGREFLREEEVSGRNLQCMLSDGLWRSRFNADPHVIGRTIRLNSRDRTIVGVMPPRFRFPETADIWIPLTYDPASDTRDQRGASVIARLRDGVTPSQARAALATFSRQFARDYPSTNADWEIQARSLHAEYVEEVGAIMTLLMAAVTFVLMIACVNVANLLLARGAARGREMAIRVALGASRGRLIRQLLTESVVIAALGAALGVALAVWGIDLVMRMIPVEMPFWMKITVDPVALYYTLGVAVTCGLLFGMAPALHASRPDLNTALKDSGPVGGAHRSRMLRGLVVAEVALSLVLLVAAGLMIRSFQRMTSERPGFDPRGLMTGRVQLPWVNYHDPLVRVRFMEQLVQRLQAVPNVASVSVSATLPLSHATWSNTALAEGVAISSRNEQRVDINVVTPDFRRTLGMSLLQGRDLTTQDRDGAPLVVLVNHTLAARWWPGQDPIGRRIRHPMGTPEKPGPLRTVVGVVADVKRGEANMPILPAVLVPALQESLWQMRVAMRARHGDAAALADPLQRVVAGLDPDLPVYDSYTMPAMVHRTMWEPRLYAWLMGVFAALALVLAAVGLYGVMAYAVAQRTREMGVRMALGATRRDLLRLVVGQGMWLTVAGLLIGLGVAGAVTRLLASLLYGVGPLDPFTYASVTVALAGTALLATAVPAHRASRRRTRAIVLRSIA